MNVSINVELAKARKVLEETSDYRALKKADTNAKRAASRIVVNTAKRIAPFKDRTTGARRLGYENDADMPRRGTQRSNWIRNRWGLRQGIVVRSTRKGHVFVIAMPTHAWLVEHGHNSPRNKGAKPYPYLVPAAELSAYIAIRKYVQKFNERFEKIKEAARRKAL